MSDTGHGLQAIKWAFYLVSMDLFGVKCTAYVKVIHLAIAVRYTRRFLLWQISDGWPGSLHA